MTMTESPPSQATESITPAPEAGQGLYGWISTSDHKTIGRIWLRVSVLLLLFVVVVGVLLSFERTDAGSVDLFGGDNSYFQMWSMYRLGLVLLVAMPLFVGLATIVVPMQVGSTNIAFPRLALASAWGYVIGAAITVISVLSRGGWGALDGVTSGEADAIALTLIGTGMVLVSIVLGAICVATTVVALRTSGMSLMRVPLFAWSMLVASAVWILTLPIALANVAIIYVDLRGGPLLFGNPEGSTEIYAQLAWLVEQPQIYAVAIPVLGVLGSVVPVVAGVRHSSHNAMVVLISLAGLFAIGGWSQPYFYDNTEFVVFVAFGLLATVPVIAIIGGSAATILAGKSASGLPPVHLMGALGAAVLLFFGTIGGAMRAVEPFGLAGTTVHTGVLNLVALSAVTAAIAGFWFWAPKIGGHLLPAGMGRLVMIDLIGGAFLLGMADVIAGFADAPDLMLSDSNDSLVDLMVIVSVVGAVIVALGVLGTFGSLVKAMRPGGPAPGDDPWDGHTLEWATSSPPPAGNFVETLAKVTSEAPLLDAASARDEGEES